MLQEAFPPAAGREFLVGEGGPGVTNPCPLSHTLYPHPQRGLGGEYLFQVLRRPGPHRPNTVSYFTVTATGALTARLPAASRATALRVWGPAPSLRVFQL